MKTAACYIRVSTDDQTEYSPDSQLKLIKEYAQKHEISLIDELIFAEDGGKSGKNMTKRSEFMKLIALTKQKQKPFDMILVWKFSRFARNQEESIVLKSMLAKRGIEVLSISETIPDGPFGSLIERIIEWSDEYYLINLSQEVKRGMKEKASRGEPVCPPPIGYNLIGGKYVPSDDAKIIRYIFDEYITGSGLRKIAINLGNMGIRTKRGSIPDNRFVEYILNNPVYIGKIRWSLEGRAASKRDYNNENTVIYEGRHEPIIDKDVYEKAQAKIKKTKELYGKYQRPEQICNYMLKGIVRCCSCGATLVMNQGHEALQCHNYSRGSCRVSHYISIKVLNKKVVEILQDAFLTGNFDVKRRNAKKKAVTTDYKKILDNELLKLERIRNAYIDGTDSLEEYKANKEHQLQLIDIVKAEMAQNEINENASVMDKEKFKKKISNVISIIKDENQSETSKNIALRSILVKIVLKRPENRLMVYFYE